MTPAQLQAFVAAYNDHQSDSNKPRYRLGSAAYYGSEAARTTILRAQIEHNTHPELAKITTAAVQEILVQDQINSEWFAKMSAYRGE